MAYVFVTGAVAAPDAIAEDDQIKQILRWIGFSEAQTNNLFDDSISDYNDLMAADESDISQISKDYSNRTVADGRINFGNKRIKRLKSLLNWTQDHRRVSKQPSVEGMNQNDFLAELDRSSERARIREQMLSDSPVKSKEASPGPLESESKWHEWENKFENYLSTLLGVDKVPLSYVIRENDLPPPAGTVSYTSFVDETIACTPLTGTFFEADSNTVHQAILSFTTGMPSEDWIKNVARHRNGRRSMKALRDHFSGEGNATRNIAEAERLRDQLHYKNERSLSFETFLTKCQKMFNIFEEENEKMEEDAKIRFLFNKIQHPGLQAPIEAMRARIATSATPVSYTTVANHMSTAVSRLPEFISMNRNISGLQTGRDTNEDSGIRNADGSIKTGFIPGWKDLSNDDKKTVYEERKRLGVKYNHSGKGGPNKSKSGGNTKTLKKAVNKLKRQVKALKATTKDKGDTNDNDDSGDDNNDDAGDQFGGKHSKKKNKKKKT